MLSVRIAVHTSGSSCWKLWELTEHAHGFWLTQRLAGVTGTEVWMHLFFILMHKNKVLHFWCHSYTHQQYSKYLIVQLRDIHIIDLLLHMATAIANIAATHCHSKLTAECTSLLHLKLSHLGSLCAQPGDLPSNTALLAALKGQKHDYYQSHSTLIKVNEIFWKRRVLHQAGHERTVGWQE